MWTSTFVSLWLVAEAQAASCCVGRTSTQAGWLAPCEHFGAGLSLGAGADLLRWRGDGLVDRSTLESVDLDGSLFGGLRFDRRWQLVAAMPVRAGWRSTDSTAAWGAGIGDPSIAVRFDPLEEPVRVGGPAAPVPFFTASLAFPAGRSDSRSEAPLGADVTGIGAYALGLSAALGRTSDRFPWFVSVGGLFEAGPVRKGLGFDVAAQLGWSIDPSWSVAAGLVHREMFRPATGPWGRTAETRASTTVVFGRPLSLRAWATAEAGLPVPGLGADLPVQARASAGLFIVR